MVHPVGLEVVVPLGAAVRLVIVAAMPEQPIRVAVAQVEHRRVLSGLGLVVVVEAVVTLSILSQARHQLMLTLLARPALMRREELRGLLLAALVQQE
jgi:hypothetical protein